jgi:hypothetical protein
VFVGHCLIDVHPHSVQLSSCGWRYVSSLGRHGLYAGGAQLFSVHRADAAQSWSRQG